VAVASFANLGKKAELSGIEAGMIEMLTTDLSQVKALQVLEQGQRVRLFQEIALGQTGLLDSATVQKAGKMTLAAKIIQGSFWDLDADKIGLKASVTDLKQNKTVEIKSARGVLADLFKLEKSLTFKLISAMGLSLTDAERMAIEPIPTENLLAFMSYSQGLEAGYRGDPAAAQTAFAEALRLDPKFKAAQQAKDQADLAVSAGTQPAAVTPASPNEAQAAEADKPLPPPTGAVTPATEPTAGEIAPELSKKTDLGTSGTAPNSFGIITSPAPAGFGITGTAF
jgi:TolB-like protein